MNRRQYLAALAGAAAALALPSVLPARGTPAEPAPPLLLLRAIRDVPGLTMEAGEYIGVPLEGADDIIFPGSGTARATPANLRGIADGIKSGALVIARAPTADELVASVKSMRAALLERLQSGRQS